MPRTSSRPATYLYGVTPVEAFQAVRPPLRAAGIGGRAGGVRTIALRGLAAVVSDVSGLEIVPSQSQLADHERVLEEVLRRSDVLPFSFGTVAANEEEVREVLLRDCHDALREQLDYVHGCVELELQAFWEERQLLAEIARENDGIQTLRDQIVTLPDGEATTLRAPLGQLTETETELKSAWEAEGVLDVLEPIAVDVLVGPNLSDTMLLNAAFLVDRTHAKDFDGAVAALGRAQARRLAFNCAGPLPPYSFVSLAFEMHG